MDINSKMSTALKASAVLFLLTGSVALVGVKQDIGKIRSSVCSTLSTAEKSAEQFTNQVENMDLKGLSETLRESLKTVAKVADKADNKLDLITPQDVKNFVVNFTGLIGCIKDDLPSLSEKLSKESIDSLSKFLGMICSSKVVQKLLEVENANDIDQSDEVGEKNQSDTDEPQKKESGGKKRKILANLLKQLFS